MSGDTFWNGRVRAALAPLTQTIPAISLGWDRFVSGPPVKPYGRHSIGTVMGMKQPRDHKLKDKPARTKKARPAADEPSEEIREIIKKLRKSLK
jgi:hypothetical protein